MTNPFDTYLFDLDGTLVDSIPDLTTSVNLLREELGLPDITAVQVRSYVGDGVGLLVQRALPPQLFSQSARQRFVEIYTENLTRETFIYPGIIPFLESQKDKMMAVVTNKPQHLAEELLENLDLTRFFQCIVGAEDGLEKKPHPAMVNFAVKELGAVAGRSLMLGDHHVDLRAAKAAGVSSCFCAWGLGHEDGLTSEYRAERPSDLATLFPGNAS
ncbi:MAG: HAD family hydrolase [Desulfuromonas sp.]|nr:MAG: HAD family hydrolase [Desulfuromonas sp.]